MLAWIGNLLVPEDVPETMGKAIDIEQDEAHALALLEDGSVIAWGRNTEGQCDVPPGLDDLVAIAAGGSHTLAQRADGSLVSWGQDSYQLVNRIPMGLGKVLAFSASDSITYVVVENSGKWEIHDIVDVEFVHTGNWLGWLWIPASPWVWNYPLSKWLYVPATSQETGEGWVYFPR